MDLLGVRGQGFPQFQPQNSNLRLVKVIENFLNVSSPYKLFLNQAVRKDLKLVNFELVRFVFPIYGLLDLFDILMLIKENLKPQGEVVSTH